jgi:hypothetical protein
MDIRSAFRRSLSLALLCGAIFLYPLNDATAEPGQGAGSSEESASDKAPPGNYGVGGTSLRLRDVWGPAKMPPAPKDFGPHFDFPPEPLNGVPLHDPYPG